MDKVKSYVLGLLFLLCLLAITACHLPSSAGEGTSESGIPPSEPAEPGSSNANEGPLAPTNTDDADVILIPGGTFMMGSGDEDLLADANEMPVHQVTISSFYLYTHEVTNSMYGLCVASGACSPVNILESGPTSHYNDPVYADFPVVGINFVDAKNYCSWAGGRLPTEAEWEFAARGEEDLRYPWGSEEPDCTRVNMLGCLVPPDTTAVGSYARGNSLLGVWDLSGNVWEWMNDWYSEGYYGLSPHLDPLGPHSYENSDKPLKVVRGGGLYSEPARMRSAARVGANPYRAFDDVGFRCVAGALELPRTYVPVDDRHEMVPPDPLDPGGEHVEDPDPADPILTLGSCLVSCPSPEGIIHLFCEIDSSEPTDYSLTLNGTAFDCYYDDFLRGLQCEGPVPADDAALDFYTVEIHAGEGANPLFFVNRPDDCPAGAAAPATFTSSIGCPDDDGLFSVTFDYEPAITWTSFQQFVTGAFVDAPCWQISENQAYCVVPVDPTAMAYTFLLLGTTEAGEDVNRLETVALPEGCPLHQEPFTADPFCFEDQPSIQFDIGPEGTVEGVSVGGAPLSCFAMAPGVWICGSLPGEPGSGIDISICVNGASCFSFGTTVPDCSGPGQAEFIRMTPACYEGIGAVVMIEYPLDMPPLASATANGAPLTCIGSPSGAYMCYVLPGTTGDVVSVEFCLDDDTCLSQDVIIQDCTTGPVGWDEPTEADWEMGATGCDSPTQIFFMLDTNIEALVPGASFTYTASDGMVDFTCSLIGAVPGRLYCAGDRPDSPGTLELCVHVEGEPAPVCGTFPDFPAWVAMIPSCEPPPDRSIDCSVYLTEPECHAVAVCLWDKMSNVCVSRGP